MNWPDDFVNRVVCGDAMELIPQIPDGSIDLVVTDPEYDLDLHSRSGRSTGVYAFRDRPNVYNKIAEGQRGIDVAAFLEVLVPKMEKFQGYFWCSCKQIRLYMNWAFEQGFYFEQLVWGKNNPPPFNKNSLLPDLEYCVLIRESRAPWYTGESRDTYSKFYLSARQKINGHPTPKPEELMSRHIRVSSKPGDVILDPFVGSGTTAVVCKKLGRNFVAFEINPKYCEEAEQRLAQTELF